MRVVMVVVVVDVRMVMVVAMLCGRLCGSFRMAFCGALMDTMIDVLSHVLLPLALACVIGLFKIHAPALALIAFVVRIRLAVLHAGVRELQPRRTILLGRMHMSPAAELDRLSRRKAAVHAHLLEMMMLELDEHAIVVAVDIVAAGRFVLLLRSGYLEGYDFHGRSTFCRGGGRR